MRGSVGKEEVGVSTSASAKLNDPTEGAISETKTQASLHTRHFKICNLAVQLVEKAGYTTCHLFEES